MKPVKRPCPIRADGELDNHDILQALRQSLLWIGRCNPLARIDAVAVVGRQRRLVRHASLFVVHYHAERNHQGLDNELIQPRPRTDASGPVRRRQRMGGMLNYYCRAA